jgi:hypothetical protein
VAGAIAEFAGFSVEEGALPAWLHILFTLSKT